MSGKVAMNFQRGPRKGIAVGSKKKRASAPMIAHTTPELNPNKKKQNIHGRLTGSIIACPQPTLGSMNAIGDITIDSAAKTPVQASFLVSTLPSEGASLWRTGILMRYAASVIGSQAKAFLKSLSSPPESSIAMSLRLPFNRVLDV